MFSCQRTINLAGKPARLPKWWNMIFISRNMIFVLCDHVFWFLPLSNQINLFTVIHIWGIIKYVVLLNTLKKHLICALLWLNFYFEHQKRSNNVSHVQTCACIIFKLFLVMMLRKKHLNSNGKQYHQYQQHKQSPCTLPGNSLKTKKTMTYCIGNLGPGLGQVQKCGRVKPM